MAERDPREVLAQAVGGECRPVGRRGILHPPQVDDIVDVPALVEVGCTDRQGQLVWRRSDASLDGHGLVRLAGVHAERQHERSPLELQCGAIRVD